MRTVWFSRRGKGSGQRKGESSGKFWEVLFWDQRVGRLGGKRGGGEGGFGRRERAFAGEEDGAVGEVFSVDEKGERKCSFGVLCFFGVYFGGEGCVGETEEDGGGGFGFFGGRGFYLFFQ